MQEDYTYKDYARDRKRMYDERLQQEARDAARIRAEIFETKRRLEAEAQPYNPYDE